VIILRKVGGEVGDRIGRNVVVVGGAVITSRNGGEEGGDVESRNVGIAVGIAVGLWNIW
jgi:hypothetical protein